MIDSLSKTYIKNTLITLQFLNYYVCPSLLLNSLEFKFKNEHRGEFF